MIESSIIAGMIPQHLQMMKDDIFRKAHSNFGIEFAQILEADNSKRTHIQFIMLIYSLKCVSNIKFLA